jgi:hypothetical protein
MNKTHYFNLGKLHYDDLKSRGVDPDTESLDYLGDSWQSKYFKIGFDSSKR